MNERQIKAKIRVLKLKQATAKRFWESLGPKKVSEFELGKAQGYYEGITKALELLESLVEEA